MKTLILLLLPIMAMSQGLVIDNYAYYEGTNFDEWHDKNSTIVINKETARVTIFEDNKHIEYKVVYVDGTEEPYRSILINTADGMQVQFIITPITRTDGKKVVMTSFIYKNYSWNYIGFIL